VEAGVPFAQVGDSGIEMLPEAAHIHFAAQQGGSGSWQGGTGNLPALDVLQRLGFTVEIVARVPSPQDYLIGRARAGRFL